MFIINRFKAFLDGQVQVAAFTGCAFTTKSESPGQHIDDSVTSHPVKTVIFYEPTLKSLPINVESFKNNPS